MKEKLRQFMMNRYGIDTLGKHMMILTIILLVLSLFMRGFPRLIINIMIYILLITSMIRMYSRNIYKRYDENQKYLARIAPLSRYFSVYKRNHQDREHKYFRCPKCHQIVRVPRGRGKIEITCPKCHTHFDKRT